MTLIEDSPRSTLASAYAPELPALQGGEPSATGTTWLPLSPIEALAMVAEDPLTETMGPWLIFPGVIDIEGQEGAWGNQAGQNRLVRTSDGNAVKETITEVVEGNRFSYTLTELTGAFGKMSYGVYGEWSAEATNGGTLLRWTWTFPARPGFNLLLKALVSPLRSAYHRRTLRLIASR